MSDLWRCLILAAGATTVYAQNASEQTPIAKSAITPVLSEQEKALDERVGQLRSLPDDAWKKAVGQLAKQIQELPLSKGKQWLIDGLSARSTEGDAGRATLQVIADTIVQVVGNLPANQRAFLCDRLAHLVRYEHVKVSLNDSHYHATMAKLEAGDRDREVAEFTLSDLKGQKWALRDLRGKVVLVNFWATWCPPCRREMPDMQALYQRFSPRGLVILAISFEDASTLQQFNAAQKYSYPILLDPGSTVYKRFNLEGVPETFVYSRDGKLVAQAIDRRTFGQFLEMLKQAGLE
jgi:peroxiredoxin